jgi:hypothetical protein
VANYLYFYVIHSVRHLVHCQPLRQKFHDLKQEDMKVKNAKANVIVVRHLSTSSACRRYRKIASTTKGFSISSCISDNVRRGYVRWISMERYPQLFAVVSWGSPNPEFCCRAFANPCTMQKKSRCWSCVRLWKLGY